MTGDELVELVAEIRRLQSELTDTEVKAARSGTPLRAVRESLSAFANRPGGGVLLFGVDEERGFEAVGVGDSGRLQEEISGIATAEMEPSLRVEFTVAEIEEKPVIALEVPEVPAIQKPAYIRARGLRAGLLSALATPTGR